MTGPLTDQRLDEIQTALAAVTTNRSTDLAERDRAYDRWGANSKQYAADLLDEIQRLRQQRDHLVSAFDKLSDQMGELVQAAQGERGRYVAENQRLRAELADAAGYLAATHRHANRHDVLGANLACAGCALLDRIEDSPQRHADGPSAAAGTDEP